MVQPDDQRANARLEYDLLHRARMNWTDAMMRWRQIVLPLVAAVVSFFIVLSTEYWAVGWFIGGLILLYWRYCENEIDTQIVRFYPRILELEKGLGMTFYSRYIFNNRNTQLRDVASLSDVSSDASFNYDGLLEAATRHGKAFVGKRGHDWHNRAVLAYFVAGALGAALYYPLLLVCS